MKTYTDADIQQAVLDYAIHHEVDAIEVDVSRMLDGDDGPVIGFRLSLDRDGVSRGCDERFGAWGR